MGSNEPVRNGCEVIYEMFLILNCGFEIEFLNCGVGWSVAPVSRGHGFKPR